METRKTGTKRQNSRAGCLRCKQRRIKCDEALPSCTNCLKRNYQCPGYKKPIKWKRKHELVAPSDAADGDALDWFSEAAKVVEVSITDKNNDNAASAGSSSPRSSDISPIDDAPTTEPPNAQTLDNQASTQDASDALLSFDSPPEALNIDFDITNSQDWLCALPLNPVHSIQKPQPKKQTQPPTICGLISDERSILVMHYFSSVCAVQSCYDSYANPFRVAIQHHLSSSRLIYYCVLSMSAAQLIRTNRHWSSKSLKYLTKAVSKLRKQLIQIGNETGPLAPQTDQVLLGVILLGTTTSWHDSSGLGLEHISGARALFKRYFYDKLHQTAFPNFSSLGFYLGLQAYWETVVSFVVDQDPSELDYLYTACGVLPPHTGTPNPWTGYSTVLWVLLAKVCSLTRQARGIIRMCSLSESMDPVSRAVAISGLVEDAKVLEEQLIQYVIPTASQADATYDENTPASHFQAVANCCRLAALLELYRTFGSIYEWSSLNDLVINNEGKTMSDLFDGDQENQSPVCTQAILRLAIEIVTILSCLPKTSGTSSIHPALFMIAGSALCRQISEQHRSAGTISDIDGESAAEREDFNIRYWRLFVHDRMTYIERLMNLDVVHKIGLLLKEVWARDDIWAAQGSSPPDGTLGSVHWSDVMIEKNMEFLY